MDRVGYVTIQSLVQFALMENERLTIERLGDEGVYESERRALICKELSHKMERSGPTDMLLICDVPVQSKTLRLRGTCDGVTFLRQSEGSELVGKDGLYNVRPVLKKERDERVTRMDQLRLAAEALCLEEMTGSGPILEAELANGTDWSERIELTIFDRDLVRETVRRMWERLDESE